MKKFLTTLLCLMLVFTMMPMATGVAFADVDVTIAGILPTDFPVFDGDTPPSNAWTNGNGGYLMLVNYSLQITNESIGDATLAGDVTSATLTNSGNDYKYTNSNGVITTFYIEDNALVYVYVEGLTDGTQGFNGTYRPVCFPTKADGSITYAGDGDALFEFTVTTVDKVSVKKAGNGNPNKIIIPETVVYNNKTFTVTSIDKKGFTECSTYLKNVEIPASVTSIGDSAFSSCTNLATVICLATTPPALGNNAFGGCTSLTTIYVPAGSADAYKNAEGWSAYASKIIEAEVELSNWSKLAKAMTGEKPEDASIKATVTDIDGTDLFTVEDADGTRTITLLSDITATSTDSALVVSGTNVVLDLNGHVLDRGLIAEDRSFSTDTNDSAIYVSANKTLSIVDSKPKENHYGYLDGNRLWHFSTKTEFESITIQGGIITGGTGKYFSNCLYGGGIYVDARGKLIISGGNIIGNYSEKGAGVCLADNSTFVMTGGQIKYNYSFDGDGAVSKKKESQCLANGTLITLKDGSKKPIEELSCGEIVRTFDHETGQISNARVTVWKYPEQKYNIICLHFSNDIKVRVASGHCFFDRSANKYVAINADNARKYIGHFFYNVDNNSWEELEDVTFEKEPDDAFIISTENHLNCVANGMLSNEDGIYTILANIFEFGDNLMINQTKKESDISKWGLWNYSESQYIPIETYNALNLKYISVALGKGMLTKAQLEYVERETANPYYESAPFESTTLGSPLMLLQANKSPDLPPGIYLGGNAVIKYNKDAKLSSESGKQKLASITNNRNLYLQSEELINLGDGLNVIATPSNGMCVGITHSSATNSETSPIPFTTKTDGDYSNYFFSDNPNYEVSDNDAGYLELKKIVSSITNLAPKASATSLNGYIDISESAAAAGDSVAIAIYPNEGYELELDSLIVTDASSTNVLVTKNASQMPARYAFQMPAKNVTVNASFKKKQEQTSTPSYPGGYTHVETAAEKHAKLVEAAEIQLAKTEIKATSKATKHNKKRAIRISWIVTEGDLALLDFDGFDVFRSTKRFSGYGKTPYFTTTKASYINNKELKKGKTYYYKVRAWKMVDGEKLYTDWSTKAWRTVK